jgi:hypothetical protein
MGQDTNQTGLVIGEIQRLEAVVRKYSRDRGTSGASRCMNSSGDITMCVVPSRQGPFSLSTTWPGALHCTRSSVLRRARDVAAQLLQPPVLVDAAAHCRVQAETLLVGAQGRVSARSRAVVPCTVNTFCPG